MKPLLYLEIKQLINSIINIVRSPKRLIPVLVMVAWVLYWLQFAAFRSASTSHHGIPDFNLLSKFPMSIIENAVFLIFSTACLIVMYGAFGSGMMVFSVAQIDFLFPTPIKRRTVLIVKLIKDYLKYLLYVAWFFMVLGFGVFNNLRIDLMPWGLVSIAAVTALLILVINIAHIINITFTFAYERLKQAGVALKLLFVTIPLSAVAVGVFQFQRTGNLGESFILAVKSPIISYLFLPVRWCARLFLAPMWDISNQEWIQLLMLTGLAVLSFFILISRRENIYEPSIGVSVNYAKRKQAMRAGDYSGIRMNALREKGTKRAGALSIPPFGQGAIALLWKALVLRYRLSGNQRLLMMLFMVLIVVALRFGMPRQDEMLRYLPIVILYIVWMMSMMAAPEARAELKQANVLKPMPIASWKIMLVQVANSTIYLSAGVFLMSAILWLMMPQTRGEFFLACVLAAPFFGFVNVTVSVLTALLYPETRDHAQSFLGSLVSFALMGLALIPSVVVGAAILFASHTAFVLAAAAISVVNLIMGSAGVCLAGMLFRRFDPTSE